MSEARGTLDAEARRLGESEESARCAHGCDRRDVGDGCSELKGVVLDKCSAGRKPTETVAEVASTANGAGRRRRTAAPAAQRAEAPGVPGESVLQLCRTLSPRALTRSLRRRKWRDPSGSGSSASRPTAWPMEAEPSIEGRPPGEQERCSRVVRSRARSGRADLVDPEIGRTRRKPRRPSRRAQVSVWCVCEGVGCFRSPLVGTTPLRSGLVAAPTCVVVSSSERAT